jgi:tRNA threonylcarbamoyladenosine biosynthesis protein TsaE
MMQNKARSVLTHNEAESRQFACQVASKLKPCDVVAFTGDLGAGKTFFCREIIKYLCGDNIKVISPTFNLLQTYEYKDFIIYHYDLYRLENISEIYELGFEEALSNNITLIEWPEIISSLLPENSILINMEIIDDNKRVISGTHEFLNR